MIRNSGYSYLLVLGVVLGASACQLSTNDPAPSNTLQNTSSGVVVVGGSGSSSGASGSGPLGPLALTSISPSSASFKAGGLVTLNGTGFNGRMRVLVNGVACPNPGIVSSTEATCLVPGTTAPGAINIQVFPYTDPTNLFTQAFNYVSDGFANVTTIAGSNTVGAMDGAGPAAQFTQIAGEALIGNQLYVIDTSLTLELNTIRLVDFSVAAPYPVTTIAGGDVSSATVSTDGPFTGTGAAVFYAPTGITAVAPSTLYVADNDCIRKLDVVGKTVTTVAGVCGQTGAVNATGTSARFNDLNGITNDGTYLYVGDAGNNMVRKIALAGYAVTTLVGQRTAGYADSPGLTAKFRFPGRVVLLGGNLYVTDFGNSAIRTVNLTTLAVSTLAGGKNGTADGTGTAAQFDFMTDLATDGTDLYVADQTDDIVRKVGVATGLVRLLAGTSGTATGVDGGIATATLNDPCTLAYYPPLGLLVGGVSVVQIQ